MKPLSFYLQRCCRPAHFILCPHQRSNIINLDLVDAPILDLEIWSKRHMRKKENKTKRKKRKLLSPHQRILQLKKYFEGGWHLGYPWKTQLETLKSREPPRPHREPWTGGHLEITIPEPKSLNFQNYFGGGWHLGYPWKTHWEILKSP